MSFIPLVFLQQILPPKYALCDTPFMTYINCYVFR